jgi:hypothetical protein
MCSIHTIVSLGSFGLFEKVVSGKKGRVYYWNEVSSLAHGKEHARAKQKGIQHQFVHPKRLQMLIMMLQ